MFLSVNPSRQQSSGAAGSSAPSTQSQSLTFWGDRVVRIGTRGNGSRVVIFAKSGGAVDSHPVDATSYTANSTFGLGSQIGTGNYCVYNGVPGPGENLYILGLSYSTTYGIRAYEFNGNSGAEYYNTSSATGNPLSHTTIAEQAWYSLKWPIVQSRRDTPHPEACSYMASKTYSGSFRETATERHCYFVADNLAAADIGFGLAEYDQTFLAVQPIGVAPESSLWTSPDTREVAGVAGDPVPALATGYAEANGSSIQNWMGTLTRNSAGVLVSYRSYNVGNISSRYSMARTTGSEDGRTLTRQTPSIINETGANNYQFCQAFYDSIAGEIILLRPNFNFGTQTEGRITSMDAFRSNDSGVGNTFTLLRQDIFNSTPIDYQGFGILGPVWRENGRYHGIAGAGVPADLFGQAAQTTKKIYPWLSSEIVEWSVDLNFTTTPIIERSLYISPRNAEVGIAPGSAKFSFGGKDYIILSCFKYRVEGVTTLRCQVTLDIKLLVSDTVSGTVVGRDIYPAGLDAFYLMHQSLLSDVFGSTTLYPKEVLTDTALEIDGAPTQDSLNRSIMLNGYIRGATWSINQQYFAIKTRIARDTSETNNVHKGILQKSGCFELRLVVSSGKFIEAWVYGVGGGIKKYRTTSAFTVLYAGLFDAMADVGMYWRLNAGGTDIDVGIIVDYVDCPLTAIQTATFTQVISNSNKLDFGRVDTLSTFTGKIGTCLRYSGSAYANADTLIREAIS